MIFADKIILLRKKQGWTQEELAEKMELSRQSISKWESAQSVPELSKIIKLSELFDVSTDYLLKDEITEYNPINNNQPISNNQFVPEKSEPSSRKVSKEEAMEFLKVTRNSAKLSATAIAMYIISATPLLLLIEVAKANLYNLTQENGEIIGTIILLIIDAIATAIIVYSESRRTKYKYLSKNKLSLDHSLGEEINEQKNAFAKKHLFYNIIGIMLLIVSAMPVMIAQLIDKNDAFLESSMNIVVIFIVAIAVFILFIVNSIQSGFDILLEEGSYTQSIKEKKKNYIAVSAVYWLIVLAIYLSHSFIRTNWSSSWIVWAVAIVLYPLVLIYKSSKAKKVAN